MARQKKLVDYASDSQEKPPSTFAIFEWRMEAEGRTAEWKAKYKEIKAETGKLHSPAMWHLLKNCPEFGYTTAKNEQAWFEANREKAILGEKRAKKVESHRKAAIKRVEEKELVVERSKEEQFVDAVRSLPPTAPHDVEFDWFRSHPAFMRKATRANDAKKVEITVDDILNAPNGPPPSQAAAYMLVNIANAPTAMMKEILSKMMKAASGGGAANINPDAPSEWDGCDDEGIKEAEAHLKRIKEQIEAVR